MRWRFLGAALGYRHILLHGLKPHQYLDVPVFGFNMRVRSYCLYVMVKIHVFVLKASCYQKKSLVRVGARSELWCGIWRCFYNRWINPLHLDKI
jgi:hypothetical protein